MLATTTIGSRVAALDAIGKQTLVEYNVVDGRHVTIIVAVDSRAEDVLALGVRLLKKIQALDAEALLTEKGTKPEPPVNPDLN